MQSKAVISEDMRWFLIAHSVSSSSSINIAVARLRFRWSVEALRAVPALAQLRVNED